MKDPLEVTPDGKFIAGRFGKMKPPASGEGKTGLDDVSAMFADKALACRNIKTVENNQWSAPVGTASQLCREDTAIKSGAVKSEIIFEFLEPPAKCRFKE